MFPRLSGAATLVAVATLSLARAHAQSNTQVGRDLYLADVTDLTALGRSGAFPGGLNGCALETTACNVGAEPIPWRMAMDPEHPFIAFLLARESNGRFEQISDRSYVKHGFFALSTSLCDTCTPTDGTTLGIGCSDTYSTSNNGDNYWLGSPDEIDPWLGRWARYCSQFDRGEPAVASPADCNGVRSLSTAQAQSLGQVGHRIRVTDAALLVPGAFWFQGMYLTAGEDESLREDDLASRAFTPSWSGSRWDLEESGELLHGSILQRWSGASLASATNGTSDGRLYVAVKVTGPVDGFWHYEYAVHNRDNRRGAGALRIPFCPDARVRAVGFSDVDNNAANDWSAAREGGEIVFTGPANPLAWNSIFNFWFDSDAGPSASPVVLAQVLPGPGPAVVVVDAEAPLELANIFVGPGCALDVPPTLSGTGSPPRATLGNASFALRSTGNAPLQPSTLYWALQPGSFRIGACTLFLGPPGGFVGTGGTVLSDANGVALHAVPIPDDLALEGRDVLVQAVSRDPGHGPLYGSFELSEALRVRVGSARSGCP
jgi:hypothetical protein